MKIGILITSISNFGESGFYNSQEIGLAKALCRCGSQVDVYKLVSSDKESKENSHEGYPSVTVHILPSRNMGINGFPDMSKLNADQDALIHFSDTQISVPSVFKWCQKNDVRYVPYIGVLESHSTSGIKQRIINLLFARNLAVYRKCHCFAKTPTIQKQLLSLGVENASVAPVGLDLSLLNNDFLSCSAIELKEKYGYDESNRVLLFVGRLVSEKEPLKMIELFSRIKAMDHRYKLLMVGSGKLESEIRERINTLELSEDIRIINRIPNDRIWELYVLADCFVNLNQNEIFGMAILEAMFYGCKVVAWKAPGPNLIIEDDVSGYLVNDDGEAIDRILNGKDVDDKAHRRVAEHFTWDATASVLYSVLAGG